MTQTYMLPKPRLWNMQQTLKCKALSTVSLHQQGLITEADQNTLVAEMKPGTDKIELTLAKDTLLVRVGEQEQTDFRSFGHRQISEQQKARLSGPGLVYTYECEEPKGRALLKPAVDSSYLGAVMGHG